jgi:hypothetical protein
MVTAEIGCPSYDQIEFRQRLKTTWGGKGPRFESGRGLHDLPEVRFRMRFEAFRRRGAA